MPLTLALQTKQSLNTFKKQLTWHLFTEVFVENYGSVSLHGIQSMQSSELLEIGHYYLFADVWNAPELFHRHAAIFS